MAKENIRARGQSIFLSEANTLTKVAESLDDHFVKVVELCYQNKGRIILTGIGKNQHIGQKIAATLSGLVWVRNFATELKINMPKGTAQIGA